MHVSIECPIERKVVGRLNANLLRKGVEGNERRIV
jgi:hypothetical protein